MGYPLYIVKIIHWLPTINHYEREREKERERMTQKWVKIIVTKKALPKVNPWISRDLYLFSVLNDKKMIKTWSA